MERFSNYMDVFTHVLNYKRELIRQFFKKFHLYTFITVPEPKKTT